MILIFPPVVKPCEPPAGVALLSAALKEQGVSCEVVDANLEGLLYLIRSDLVPKDSWAKRALKHREQIIEDLKTPALYENMDRYHQRVYDLNKLLSISVDDSRFRISLSDYSDNQLSSVDSKDLIKSADLYWQNPFYPYFETALADKIENNDSEWVGISLCYLNQALVSFALAGWIKDRGKKIVMGGGLISSWMARTDFQNPFESLIDVVVKGEGEQKLAGMLGKPGIKKRHFVPDYDFVENHVYLSPGKVLPFRASIGCYWRKCRFCPEKAEARPYNARHAAKVMADIKCFNRKYRPDYIHFVDNAITPSFLDALSQQNQGFQWYGFVRFEKEFLNAGFCRNLKSSGCGMLKLGLESGDQSVLDQMNKGTNLASVSRILKNLHGADILTFVYLLFGTRFEDKAAAVKTLDFINAHAPYIDYLNLAVFNLPRYSEDAKGLETRKFYHGDLSLYLNFTHPHGWDRRRVKQFLDKTIKKRIHFRARIQRTPAFFSSNHAVFFQTKKEERI